MRILSTILIAVLLMASVARAGLPGLPQGSCSGDLVAADVCEMPGMPTKTSKPTANSAAGSCCAALPDMAAQGVQSERAAGYIAMVLARARLLPDRADGLGPWRPPRG